MTVEDSSKVDEILGIIDELTNTYVKVGVLSKEGGEMLMIANVHEFGVNIKVTEKMRAFFAYNFGAWIAKDMIKIPERSFIRSSFDKHEKELNDLGMKMLPKVIEKEISVNAFYSLLGQKSVNYIRGFITAVIPPGLSPLTLSIKGANKGTPLIDTGHLISSISYEIVGG